MKNILHQGIVLHPKAQGKQHRWSCMGKGAIVSRETIAPITPAPHPVGIKSRRAAPLDPSPPPPGAGLLPGAPGPAHNPAPLSPRLHTLLE